MHDQRSAITRDGRRLTYLVTGSGPPLICHPGGPGFDGTYFEDLGGLAARRTLVLVNPAGARDSDPWPGGSYSLPERADDVEDIREALGEEQVDVLGHSAGGWVGVKYASAYPERVRKLVLVGVLTRFDEAVRDAIVVSVNRHADEPWFEDAVDAHARRVAREYTSDDEFVALYMQGFRFFFATFGETEQAYVERMNAAGARIDLRTLESFNDRASELDLRSDLPGIEAETLVVNGELEAARASERELVEGIRRSTLALIEGAGHFPWIEQRERWSEAVLPFLSS
jgi:pimeloyl-ACP methyl ester carboxylesterase